MDDWKPIETAPKPSDNRHDDSENWILGYTSWGQHVGKFHEWAGPCEWQGERDGWQFANAYADEAYALAPVAKGSASRCRCAALILKERMKMAATADASTS